MEPSSDHAPADEMASDARATGTTTAAPVATATSTATAAAPTAATATADDQDPDPAGLLRRMSGAGARFTAGSLKELVTRCAGIPGLVGLHGGLVPEGSFPLASLQLSMPGGAAVQLTPQALAVGQQQYSLNTSGYPPLLAWVEEHVRELHGAGRHKCMITDGSTHGLEVRCGCGWVRGSQRRVGGARWPGGWGKQAPQVHAGGTDPRTA